MKLYKCNSNGSLEKDFLNDLFLEYKDLVDSIKARNKSNILLDTVIQDWNNKLKHANVKKY